jgi:phosphoribosylaminoimidazole-succinocarboxamide synthase
MALTQTSLEASLPLIARGKVRDVYALSDDSILFVATDRISAYDVVMTNVEPLALRLLYENDLLNYLVTGYSE